MKKQKNTLKKQSAPLQHASIRHAFYAMLLGIYLAISHPSAVAQTFSTKSSGYNNDIFVINDDNSNNWSYLRLQVYNNKAWNMVNQGDLWWGYATNSTYTDRGTEKMRLTSSGRLGIGITNPNANLDVAGIAHFSGLTSPSTPIQGAYIGWNALTSSTGETDFINHKGLGTGGFAFYNTGGDGSSRTLQMLIDGNGNVGIGVTRPSQRLEVAGNVRTNGLLTVIGAGNSSFSGNLGIGTTTIPIGSKLAVNGKITAKALQLTKVGWSDFVFDEQYVLPSLTEVEAFIKKNKHLSKIPSAKEVEEQGIDMGKMHALLLQKIEELTLYIIHQQKEIETLKTQVNKK